MRTKSQYFQQQKKKQPQKLNQDIIVTEDVEAEDAETSKRHAYNAAFV